MNRMARGMLLVALIAVIIRLVYNYWVFLPAVIHMIYHPTEPNRPVQWKSLPPKSENSEKPNIVLIVGDDMGFSDLSLYGGFRDLIKTPNIDSIGLDGVYFKNAYAGQSLLPYLFY
jgi:glucan phosphoethanolaminetransferase (alkaline phosphatase superfamily)